MNNNAQQNVSLSELEKNINVIFCLKEEKSSKNGTWIPRFGNKDIVFECKQIKDKERHWVLQKYHIKNSNCYFIKGFHVWHSNWLIIDYLNTPFILIVVCLLFLVN